MPFIAKELFADTRNRYRLFREHILPQLRAKREQLNALYCLDNGRPAIDPVVACGVSMLQFMEKAVDRKAEENVRLHLGWKYALDLEVDYNGFDHSSLRNFRDRLLEGGAERIGFDALLDGLRATGLVKRRCKQRLDSTHVLGSVAKMSRLELVRETLRLVLEWLDGMKDVRKRLPGYDGLREKYVESDIPWHRVSLETLSEKFVEAGRDALLLICWARQQPRTLCEDDRVLLLERVFLEQYELSAEGSERRKVEGSGVVKNPHDPDVQWAAKNLAATKQWEGYKVQIAETVADEPAAKENAEVTDQFVVEVVTTQAITSDLAGMKAVLESEQAHGQPMPIALHVDAAYVTDDTLAEAQKEGLELIGPARPCGNAPGNGFGAEQFDVSNANRRAVCPAGHESRQCSLINDAHKAAAYFRYEWASLCDDCPLREQCTKSRKGRRILAVGVHHDLLQQRRRQMQTQAYQQLMRHRNGIEGTISEFARAGGRRTRYRSLAKTRLANYFQAAAVNANRWIRLIQWQRNENMVEMIA